MRFEPIEKPAAVRARANLGDYVRSRRDFTWSTARAQLSGLPDGRGLNIAYEAVDRHAAGPRADHTAVRWVDLREQVHDLSYLELAEQTNRFANVLQGLDLRAGERVFTLLGRQPELYVAAFGTLKAKCVLSPLFSAFGPDPIAERLRLGGGRVLVTTPGLYRRKIAKIRHALPELRHILLTGAAEPGTTALGEALAAASPDFDIPATEPETMALLHFTSGTTGKPKGAVHVHEAVLAHHVTAAYALDLHPEDIFWCTADSGWVTGTSYGIIAPLSIGATLISDAGDFEPRRWYDLLSRQRVSVWYTAPTALRMLMRQDTELAAGYDLSALRFVASVGEPLNPEVVVWAQRTLGLPVHDNWWQTETGAIMISNYAAEEVRPGSMGRPVPGVDAGLLARGEDGRALVTEGAVHELSGGDVEGELALQPGWPSMFRGYLNDPERYEKSFAGGWYLTGDIVRRDSDGYFWFVGRADDVIKSAGHLIGPFEVESVLMEHPAVAEAGVIGKPDELGGELVKAFVSLRPGVVATEELRVELLAFGRRALGALAPKEIVFDQDLPHTRSGKVMRRLLKARELGLPEGDLSTLESSS